MSCISCSHPFEEDEGRFHYSDGSLCRNCKINIKSIKVVPKKITTSLQEYVNLMSTENQNIGKYNINGELLLEYVHAVDLFQFTTAIEMGPLDMYIIQNGMDRKKKALLKILQSINLPNIFVANNSESIKFIEDLDKWIENILLPQAA